MAALPLIPILCLGGALAADETPLLPPSLRIERLGNGLTVVAAPAPTPGLVAVQTWMDVGARDEVEPGMTGFAHFFEHLMFHGSEALPRDVREKQLLALAVDENAWTDEDRTVYVSRAPAASLGPLLKVEADRFADLSLTADGVRREAGAVYGEFRKGLASPDNRIYELLRDTAFDTSTYGHPVIGLEEDIAGMPDGLDRAVAFHRTFYRPERAVLVVTGDIDPAAVVDMARRTHGGWQGHPDASAAPERPEEPPQEGARVASEVWADGPVNPRVAVGWRVPAFVPGDADGAALVLLSELLSGPSARLRRRLVEEEALAWWVWVPEATSRSDGLLEIYVEGREGVDPARIEAVIAEEIAALGAPHAATRDAGRDPVAEVVSRAAAKARRAALLELDSAAAWASAIGEMTLLRGEPRDLEQHVDALGAVGAADVRRVVGAYLVPETRTTVHLVPAPPAAEVTP
jgi:zinc protease